MLAINAARTILDLGGWVAPCVEIEDRPRFTWRGLVLDPARHFMPPEFINKAGNFPTQAMLDYLRPLVGELPEFARLRYKGL